MEATVGATVGATAICGLIFSSVAGKATVTVLLASLFNRFQQESIGLMMNPINFYGEKKLNNRSAYRSFSFLYGEHILAKLGAHHIGQNSILLTPKLLKKQSAITITLFYSTYSHSGVEITYLEKERKSLSLAVVHFFS